MSTATEEAGLTARTLVEAFRSTPALLAVVMFNLMFIGVVGYLSHSNHSRWERDSARWAKLIETTVGLCTTRREGVP